MPKRPCAVALTPDESNIICVDKFGDVYSLPLLLPVSSGGSNVYDDQLNEAMSSSATRPSRPFVPAANDLTVHSVCNRKALQNQMRQKLSTSEKVGPQFERSLLLGHVSMLTDIALVERNGAKYIITADRDEHIRISRGIPQTHIIEGYCLGHKEFVSRLCLPATRPYLLISGGGDDDIYVWNWLQRKLLQKVNLRNQAEELMQELLQPAHPNGEVQGDDATSPERFKIAVSSIQHMRGVPDRPDEIIIVTCEG
jgi:tRNA (guanine-N(7)-)-methyltransferase subunit TRM82